MESWTVEVHKEVQKQRTFSCAAAAVLSAATRRLRAAASFSCACAACVPAAIVAWNLVNLATWVLCSLVQFGKFVRVGAVQPTTMLQIWAYGCYAA